MKKIIKALLVVMVLAMVVMAFAACEKDPCKNGHTMEAIAEKLATCTEDGYSSGVVCSVCGYAERQSFVLEAKGHDMAPATCEKPSTCKREGCGYTEGGALGHDMKDVAALAPTCTKAGYTAHTACATCGKTEGKTAVAALGHTEVVDAAVAATCTTAGKTEGKHCSVCNEVLVAQEEVVALGHDLKDVEGKAATCTEAGYTAYKDCSRCDYIEGKTTIDAKGHNYEGVVTTQPTCTVDGVKTYTCKNDSTHTYTEAVAKLGHDLKDVTGKAATCTEAGYTAYKDCSRCDYIEGKATINAKGHTEVVDAAKAPTCEATGLTEGKHCSVCKDVIVAQKIVDALGHTEVVDAAVDATCTEAGKTAGKHCSECNKVLVAQQTVNALGHKDVNPADYICDVCEADLCTEHIPGDPVIENEVAPTCENKGSYDSVVYCSQCHDTISRETKEEDALGHDMVAGEKVDPTFDAQGYTPYTCANGCGKTENRDTVEKLVAKAEANGQKYQTFAEAWAAGGEIVLHADVTLDTTLVVNGTVVLNLNGYTISMEDASSTTASAIKNNGNLTIKDGSELANGKITFVSTTPSANFGYSTSTIVNSGNLTVESGTIENTTNGGASYAIDTAWYSQNVSITINGGTISAVKVAVRQVPFSTTYTNTVTINGGTLSGYAGLQIHAISGGLNLATVNITGGTLTGTYSFYSYYSAAETSSATTVAISGGTFNGYVYLYNPVKGSDAYPMDVEITDGTFNGGVYVFTYDAEGNYVDIPAITGGTFDSEDAADYLKDGYHLVEGVVGAHVEETLEAKTPTCTETGLTEGKKCSVCGAILVAQNEVAANGHNYSSEVKDPTCTASGSVIFTCSCGDTYTIEGAPATGHVNTTTTTVDAKCTTDGSVTVTCACGHTVSTTPIPATGHNWLHKECQNGCETAFVVEVVFDFGANGSASHVDGDDLGSSKSYTVGNYTLSLTGMSKVFGSAYDAKGNSAIKLGTGSVAASLTFEVPADITKVTIYVAKYKGNATTVTVNGTNYTISTSSNDGAYTPITVDTTSTKTITIATTSSNPRAMIDKIVFAASTEHDHKGGNATCENLAVCDICDETYGSLADHTPVEDAKVDPTCQTDGKEAGTHCDVCGDNISGNAVIDKVDHSYNENDECIWCGESSHVHNFTSVVTDPTCQATGYTTHTCDQCEYSYTDNETDKVDHKDANDDYKCDYNCGTVVLPAENEALTVAQAIAVAKAMGNTYTTQKYYITGIVSSIPDSTHGNFDLVDENGDKILIYGLWDQTGAKKYGNMTNKPLKGDEITIYTVLGCYNGTPQGYNAWTDEFISHTHSWVDATCKAPKTCSVCETTEGSVADHTYVGGKCTGCGKEEGAASAVSNAKLDFSNKNNRTTFTTSQQVWEQNGVKLTNDKSSSTSNVADYASPARFYKGSKITIEAVGIKKIIFDCNSNAYANDLKTSIGTVAGATVTVSGDKVTVEFTTAVDSFIIAKLSAKVFMDSITINP